MKMVQEEIRKGPWTEQEDLLLVNFVHLFGDRRWDFIANVSGLNRTGKSCRLRWVNYLHPGLKRGKMTPQEERLVLELHAKWGNRWSRIARKLPGRTDNEIKNYWRTHMRKKAQEKKRSMSPTSSSSSTITTVDSLPFSGTGKTSFYDTGGHDDEMVASAGKNSPEFEDEKGSLPFPGTGEASFYDTGGLDEVVASAGENSPEFEDENGYSMDDIWKELSEENTLIKPLTGNNYSEEGCNNFSRLSMASPSWDFCWASLWKMDEEDSKMFLPTSQFLAACYEFGKASITG